MGKSKKEEKALVELSETERQLVESYREKKKATVKTPYVIDEDEIKEEIDDEMRGAILTEATGVVCDSLSVRLINDAVYVIEDYGEDKAACARTTVSALRSIGPQDGIEGLLANQMVATHFQAIASFQKANLTKDVNFRDRYTNMATKLSRTFIAQLEALNKYRGKGQQKMTVEHVHVNDGGQAIVGSISAKGGD